MQACFLVLTQVNDNFIYNHIVIGRENLGKGVFFDAV